MSSLHKDKIIEKVTNAGCVFKHSVHEAVTTSEHASHVRGVPLSSGAKALVLYPKANKEELILVVIPAHKKIDFKKLKQHTGKDYTFAVDVGAQIDCVPGSVPPFGSVLGLPTYADSTLVDELNFNIGLLTESMTLSREDYFKIENPIVGEFSKEA